MVDVETPYSDGWWLKRLLAQMYAKPVRSAVSTSILDSRRFDFRRDQWLDLLWAHYTGEPPMPGINDKWANATREFLRLAKTQYGSLVVEAMLDRVQFIGVRHTNSAASDADGDDDVRALMKQSGAFWQDAEEFAFALGEGYVLVGPDGEGGSIATAEDPREVTAIQDPLVPHRILAALKIYDDDLDEQTVAAVYLRGDAEKPDRVATFVTDSGNAHLGFNPDSWTLDEDRSKPLPIQGLGVPVVRLPNRNGMGEFEKHLDLLDRIYNGVADRLWTAKYQAFRQRGIQSDNLPDTDEDGKKVNYDEIFESDPGALWRLPGDTKMWESSQSSVSEILAPIRDDVKELAAVSRTPLHMFTPDAMTGSAEGASLAREGISFKAEDRIARWSPDAIRVARLLLAYSGQEYDVDMEAMFAPVERLSLSQRMQAGAQAKTAGVPAAGVWADVMQMSPETVKRWTSWAAEEQLFAGLGEE